MTSRGSIISTLSLGALLLAGCGDNDADVNESGTLELTWTVDESTSEAACDAMEAVLFETTVSFAEGNPLIERQAPCGDFRLIMKLVPADYTASAALINASDEPMSDQVVVREFTIVEDETTTVEVSFPGADSD